jgi:transcriptional regulator
MNLTEKQLDVIIKRNEGITIRGLIDYLAEMDAEVKAISEATERPAIEHSERVSKIVELNKTKKI